MHFTDTHCHLHFADYPLDADSVLTAAQKVGVDRVIAVGCSLADSRAGVAFAAKHSAVWASIGLHPHEAEAVEKDAETWQEMAHLATMPKVVAIGETGLDYYYQHASPKAQKAVLKKQLDLANSNGLPLIFHVREAFDDFWSIYDAAGRPPGVIHSFTATKKELDAALDRGLYIGLNGIVTFTKQAAQLEAARQVPMSRLLLETDAPFLTPAPFRGKICEPKYVRVTAEFLASLRGQSLDEIATASSQNATQLFKLGERQPNNKAES